MPFLFASKPQKGFLFGVSYAFVTANSRRQFARPEALGVAGGARVSLLCGLHAGLLVRAARGVLRYFLCPKQSHRVQKHALFALWVFILGGVRNTSGVGNRGSMADRMSSVSSRVMVAAPIRFLCSSFSSELDGVGVLRVAPYRRYIGR